MLEELRAAFDCEPNKSFELRREPRNHKKLKYLTRPTPGGGIAAEDGGSNPLRIPNDIVNEEPGALGTLTMFYFQENSHYALTCFHVACQTDEQRFNQAFNAKDLSVIRESHSVKWYNERAKTCRFYYRPRENASENENVPSANKIGRFCKGFFDPVSDIMSLKVFENVGVDCQLEEIEFPSWERIWQELHRRVVRRRGTFPVRVKKIGYSSNETYGYIEEINYTWKYGDEILLRSAIAVRSDDGPFMKPGDSGSLVCFFDEENRQQAFGYGVCEVGDFADEQPALAHEENRSLLICFKLNTALKSLNLPTGTGCFRRCGSDQ